MFVVTKIVKNNNGRTRYYVKDVNHHSKTRGLKGYITTNAAYVRPIYYATTAKKVTIINPTGITEYKNKNLTKPVKHFKQGTTLRVVKLVKHNLTTRYQLANGHYITANRKLVTQGNVKLATKVKVTNRQGINLYKQTKFTNKVKVRHYKKGTVLVVKNYEYTSPNDMHKFGVKRYAVKGGYITAATKYVKVVKAQ